MLALAKEFDKQPVVFIGVISGYPREAIEKYSRKNNIDWPMIVDAKRNFERQIGVKEIGFGTDNSTINLSTTVYVSNGDIRLSSFKPKKAAVRNAIRKASWKINPSKVPTGLEKAWKACEFADCTPSEATKKFQSAVLDSLNQDAARFWNLGKERNHAEAYRAYLAMQHRYKGYEIPAKVLRAGKWLKQLPELKDVVKAEAVKTKARKMAEKKRAETERRETKAQQLLDDGWQKLRSSKASARRSGYNALKRVTLEYSDTKAAKEASALLKNVKIITSKR